jgi:hypothetical protein
MKRSLHLCESSIGDFPTKRSHGFEVTVYMIEFYWRGICGDLLKPAIGSDSDNLLDEEREPLT